MSTCSLVDAVAVLEAARQDLNDVKNDAEKGEEEMRKVFSLELMKNIKYADNFHLVLVNHSGHTIKKNED